MIATAWGEDPDNVEARIVTDMYGSVTVGVHEFLRDRAVTPAEWQALSSHFGWRGHGKICEWVSRHSTDAGRYDAYNSERALDRLQRNG
ncbi:hypothetical protein MUG78_17830 [Gordonia alkaliphila]|uniref:hypothetical protein n=1 Tax=Gordonia alkaliphila TaxID=1053547 RepID=UPI001FF5F242|nr:hypothetical protein [Gordonia alkaliphila]MCK0441262.1 hypothetical protein [Gordonia alkaliphila]